MKNNPTVELMMALTNGSSSIWRSLKGYAKALADSLRPIILDQWNRRDLHAKPAEVEIIFGPGARGSVDSAPIYVQRPKEYRWQSALYNGKYKGHVLKLQCCCTFQGVPIWIE
jgi:hypothetical protein